MKNEMKGGSSIENIVGKMMEIENMKVNYERMKSDMMEWIRVKMMEMEKKNLNKYIEGIKKELINLKKYRKVEKKKK